jgi:DNA-binding CsgD family transcriptional regulator
MNLNSSEKQSSKLSIPTPLAEKRTGSWDLSRAENPHAQSGRKSEGFLLLNAAMLPIFANRAAVEVLTYPQKPEDHQKNLEEFVTNRIRALLVAKDSYVPMIASEFFSGSRHYRCRAYRVHSMIRGDSEASLAVILERAGSPAFSLTHVSKRFHLSGREQEVMEYLLSGLTTKQIAAGMSISPNTVKAFLRMIMMKMGVSTRSAIVAQAFLAKP